MGEGEYQEEQRAIFLGSKRSFVKSAVRLQKELEDKGYKKITVNIWVNEIRFNGIRESHIYAISDLYGDTILKVFIPEDEWGRVKNTWGLIKEALKIEGGHRVEPPEDQNLHFKELKEIRARFFATQKVFKNLTSTEKDIVLAMVETDSETYDQLEKNWPSNKKAGTIKSQVNNSIKKKLGYEGKNWRVMQSDLKAIYGMCSKSTKKE